MYVFTQFKSIGNTFFVQHYLDKFPPPPRFWIKQQSTVKQCVSWFGLFLLLYANKQSPHCVGHLDFFSHYLNLGRFISSHYIKVEKISILWQEEGWICSVWCKGSRQGWVHSIILLYLSMGVVWTSIDIFLETKFAPLTTSTGLLAKHTASR